VLRSAADWEVTAEDSEWAEWVEWVEWVECLAVVWVHMVEEWVVVKCVPFLLVSA
jgi:hypothetical protein